MTYQRYTITAALPYANGGVHIGHLAGAYIPADIYVRYLRRRYGKEKVLFVCGSDEHGVPITLRAQKEGITPQELVDKYHHIMGSSFAQFGIDFDIYHRTSDPLHHETAAHFFKKMYDAGVLPEKESEQYYDTEQGRFLADRYIIGTCPRCANENAYGDQCEKCGSTLSPQDLIRPRSALSGSALTLRPTTHWYLPLDSYQQSWLNAWILEGEGRSEAWKNSVMGQCRSWLEQGLQPRAVTRDLEWGVALPIPHTEGKVLYVWFDAPIGYISASKAWAAQQAGRDWRPFWQSSDSKLVHFIGKDNIVFHCIIFPAMLRQMQDLGEPYILPVNIPANEFLNLEGEKISTSRNHAVWLDEYLQDFPQQQDALRYALTSIIPESKDSDFTWADFQLKVNSELVAILGNFVNRVLVLTHKFLEGKTPSAKEIEDNSELRTKILAAYRSNFEESNKNICNMIAGLENYRFREAQAEMMNLARGGNKFLADCEPWKIYKSDPEACAAVLSYALELTANIAVACEPFLPNTARRILEQLRLDISEACRQQFWEQGVLQNILPEFHTLNSPELLFRNIEDEEIKVQTDRLAARKAERVAAAPAAVVYAPLKESIAYDDFAKLDLRTATIVAAERIPKADKLLKLTLNVGFEERTVLSGIAEHFEPEAIIGRQVLLLANLAPRTMRGVVSNGMILMAEDAEGKLHFVAPPVAINNGATIS
ncbi:MAG: methionine--tRNA ligase [Sphingobacteriales bacterium]|nr:methionine--tRNA ligase [Sphingobacteriales bacterium]